MRFAAALTLSLALVTSCGGAENGRASTRSSVTTAASTTVPPTLPASAPASTTTSPNSIELLRTKVVHHYPHDTSAFTEGLVFRGRDAMFESLGLDGKSSVRQV